MALQDGGQISLGDIATEMGVSLSNVSLGTQSTTNVNQNSTSKPDGSQPHSISEFYGYDHNASSGPTLTEFGMGTDAYFDPEQACGEGPNRPFGSHWHNGAGASPVVGDVVYEDSAGTNIFVGKRFWFWDKTGNKSININNEGRVDDEFSCE